MSSRFPTRSNTNRAVQPQKMARGLKFLIQDEGGWYYLRSENKGSDQLHIYRAAGLVCAFVFAYATFLINSYANKNLPMHLHTNFSAA